MTQLPFDDARQLQGQLEADVCVVGAGAAGIVVGLRLAQAGYTTLLLEGGGTEESQWTDSHFPSSNLGASYHDLSECRTHRFGGTTHEYGGFSRPVSARDFDPVPGSELATWPMTYEDLAPWVDRARHLVGFEADDFDLDTRLRQAEMPEAPSDGGIAETSVFARPDPQLRAYSRLFADDLASQRRLRIILHALVTHIRLSPAGGSVTALDAATEGGNQLSVRARCYVLACGGVENARLLLDSNEVLPEGIGNRSGMLGRCLMDHPHVERGRVRFDDGPPLHLVLPEADKHDFAACITVPQAVTDEAGCFSYFCRLLPIEHQSAGEEAVRKLIAARRRPFSREFSSAALGAAKDPLPATLAASRLFGVRPREFVLNHRIEQAPNPSSRIVLLDERDELGRRLVGVDWHLSDVDVRTFEVGQAHALEYLESIGASRIRASQVSESVLADAGSTYWHNMGTTRMSTHPSDGVVDPNCRVHGVDNLYVAGSSVFCRGTFSPPTMTIVAFGLRLAAHLQESWSR